MFGFGKKEERSVENPQVPISSEAVLQLFGLDALSAADEVVTIDSALGVPAVWAAVNFLSGTLAGLPLKVFKKTKDGRAELTGQLASMLHDAPNEEMSSFEWRKYLFDTVFTHGRSVTFIERNTAGTPMYLWPLEPSKITYRMERGRRLYDYDDNGKKFTYAASDVIDIPFMVKPDRLHFYSPITSHKDVIGMAQAATKYAGRFFAGGGVPPFAVEGPFQSPAGLKRASKDIENAIAKASKEKRLSLTLPSGHSIKQLGTDPAKAQLADLQRFLIEQIARIYSMPPTFLQDLTHGTFSNTEQQDLHFVKHTVKRWVEQFEQELNLKLFGRNRNSRYVELNVDGLLRGDFKTRMDGMAQAVQNAIMKPNEVRMKLNLPDDPQGNVLLVQGATVPLGQQPTNEE